MQMGQQAHEHGQTYASGAAPAIATFGAWAEQLIAKKVPASWVQVFYRWIVNRSGPPEVYSNDRLFVYLRLESETDGARTMRFRYWKLPNSGDHANLPGHLYDLGGEFFSLGVPLPLLQV